VQVYCLLAKEIVQETRSYPTSLKLFADSPEKPCQGERSAGVVSTLQRAGNYARFRLAFSDVPS